MIAGLYAAANGMRAVEDRQAVVANNISNASTPGFKRQLAVTRGYYESFTASGRHPAAFNRLRAPGGGIKVIQTHSDYANGLVANTGNSLDVAVAGPGFIGVNTPDGERFTRSGRFSIGVDGNLVTLSGDEVQDTSGGGITATGGPVEIHDNGAVYVNAIQVGQIRLVELDEPHMLDRAGYSLFSASNAAHASMRPAEATSLVSGAIEASNVQVPIELSNMTLALRSYAANQRVITAIDETLNRLIDQVGAPS